MRISIDGFKLVVIGAAISLVAGVASNMLRTDIDNEQADYCRYVKEGTYPDYKGIYAAECGDGEPPVYRKSKLSKADERIVLTL